jgi:excisionase family DNA binding protein
MSDRPLTVAQLADRWSCSRRHIYNLIDRDELHIFRAGGTLFRISWDEVRRWENGGSPTRSEFTASESSEIKPSPHGETPMESTESDLAERRRKLRREASLTRMHNERQRRSQPTPG